MPNRHLHICPAVLEEHKGRKEPVHAFEQRQPPGTVSPQHLQGTARVQGTVMCHHAPETVGDPGLQLLESAVTPVSPDTCHHAVILYIREKQIEILRICLEVSINIADKLRLRIVNAGFQCSTQAPVAGKLYINASFLRHISSIRLPEPSEEPSSTNSTHAGTLLDSRKPASFSSSLAILSASLYTGTMTVKEYNRVLFIGSVIKRRGDTQKSFQRQYPGPSMPDMKPSGKFFPTDRTSHTASRFPA